MEEGIDDGELRGGEEEQDRERAKVGPTIIVPIAIGERETGISSRIKGKKREEEAEAGDEEDEAEGEENMKTEYDRTRRRSKEEGRGKRRDDGSWRSPSPGGCPPSVAAAAAVAAAGRDFGSFND